MTGYPRGHAADGARLLRTEVTSLRAGPAASARQWHDPAVTERTLQADANARAQFRGAKTAVVVRHNANRDLSERLLHDQPTQRRRAATEVDHDDKLRLRRTRVQKLPGHEQRLSQASWNLREVAVPCLTPAFR
jgi:hypothetical protein